MSNSNSEIMDPATWEALQNMTLQSAPQGVTPNFTNPAYNGTKVIVAGAIGLVFVTGALIARLYTIFCLRRKARADDYIYFISWIFGVALICLQISVITRGVFGHHSWDIKISEESVGDIVTMLIVACATGPLLWITKLTLFSLILTAFSPLRYTKALVYGGVMISGLLFCGAAFGIGVACGPRGGTSREAYVAGITDTKCASNRGQAYQMTILQAVMIVVTDFYIFCLPLPALAKLQLPPKKKLGVSFVFLVAFAACIISIVSLFYRFKVFSNNDDTWTESSLLAIIITELSLGLVIPCAASVARIYRHWYAKRHGLSYDRDCARPKQNNEKAKRGIMGQDEMVLYSTHLRSVNPSNNWNDVHFNASRQHSNSDSDRSKFDTTDTASLDFITVPIEHAA